MTWVDLVGRTIISAVPDQVKASEYRQPMKQEDCWTYSIELTFSDGSVAIIEGLQHDEVGGIHLRGPKLDA